VIEKWILSTERTSSLKIVIKANGRHEEESWSVESVDGCLHVSGEGTASRDGKTFTLSGEEPFVITANDCTRYDMKLHTTLTYKVNVAFHVVAAMPPPIPSKTTTTTTTNKKKRSKPAAVFSIFNTSSSKKKKKTLPTNTYQAKFGNPVVKLPSNWWAYGTLIAREFNTTLPSRPVAAFDFDGCLVRTNFNQDMTLPRDLISEYVVPRLQILHDKGYTIAILSNEASIGNRTKKSAIENAIRIKTSRMEAFASLVNRPMWLLVASCKDKYRKPDTKKREGGTKMWDHVLKHSKISSNDVKKCFYVGDSAGRPGDHSDCDKNFAKLCNLRFYTQTDFFGTKPILSILKTASSVSSTFFEDLEEQQNSKKILLVLVGLPGSGKSYFASKLSKEKWGIRVCQDVLKSKEKCKIAVQEAFLEGKSVVIDRTNVTLGQRRTWLDIAKYHNDVSCFCLTLQSDSLCNVRQCFYTPHSLITYTHKHTHTHTHIHFRLTHHAYI